MDRGLVPTVGRPAHWPAPKSLTAEQVYRLGFQPGIPLPIATPDLEHPAGSQVAFVLSCPGKEEARCGHPTVGATGHNLTTLLKELRDVGDEGVAFKKYGIDPASLWRGRVTIANAWPEPVWKRDGDERSEASIAEITRPENIRRLASILQSHSIVVLCGNKAMEAFDRMQLIHPMTHDPEVVRIAHLGARGLNSVRKGHGLTHQQKLRLLARVIAGVAESSSKE